LTKISNFIEILLGGRNQFSTVNLINLNFTKQILDMTKYKKKKKRKPPLFGNDIFFQFSDVMSLASILKERLIIKWQQVF
jgi:hypothetical protein